MRARVAASAALAALLAVTLAGCNFFTPQTTLKPYDASDGVSTIVGDVHISNALVLSEDGVSGNLLFTAVNDSNKPVDLTVQYESLGKRTDLPLKVDASGSSQFGFGDGGQLFLTAIDTKPGGVIAIYFQYGDQPGKQLMVPVLDGSLEQYSPFLPQTPTPTPTPIESGTPTPDPTATPAG
ncbi:MAG: hypothetical protein JWP32_756 [Schumannella sp.]|nr:hypothetical protein [Schumannella sp.]